MNPISKVEVTDREGWCKEFRLSKTIIHIGGDARNDIVLDREGSRGAAAQHAQLITLAEGYRLINLSGAEIILGASGERSVGPQASVDIADGDQLAIGEYTIVLGSSGGIASLIAEASTSAAIGLSLFMSHTELSVGRPIDGSVMVRNLGDKPGAQFIMDVEGLEPDSYDIGPGPILYPNAEKEVLFRFRHPQRPVPLAGKHRVSIRVSTPEAYPGQDAVVTQEITILPFCSHRLRLVKVE